MKTHAIIPIFIPHDGCGNDCVFCNQKAITARSCPPSVEDARKTIERYLPTLRGRGIKTVEIAFFGGSFTGIPMERQRAFLAMAKEYKDAGIVQKLHLSTRPDYIDEPILNNLKDHGVDIIELGVQSFDEEVLRLSGRGHAAEAVYQSAKLIAEYGFTLGIQLMIGLPGDTPEKDIFSAREAVKLSPQIARLYPTVVLRETELLRMYENGSYLPLSEEEAVNRTKAMYVILREAGVNVIRIGLKSTDLIKGSGEIAAGSYHPAFRQLVEAEIAKESLEKQLQPYLAPRAEGKAPSIRFESSGRSFSNMIGNSRSNRIYFEEKYPGVNFSFCTNQSLPDDCYMAKGET